MDRKLYALPSGLKLNLGCGPVQPLCWDNIDGSNRAFLASKYNFLDRLLVKTGLIPPSEFGRDTKYQNLLRGLPYEDNTVACIYAGELWEHFEYKDAIKVTKECYRVLKKKGVLRVCVPDGTRFWGKYLTIFQIPFALKDIQTQILSKMKSSLRIGNSQQQGL